MSPFLFSAKLVDRLNQQIYIYANPIQLYRSLVNYRVTHKGCDYSDGQNLLKSNEFEGISVII